MGDKYYSQSLNSSFHFNNSFYLQESLPDLLTASVPQYNCQFEENRLPVRYFSNQSCNMNIKLSNGFAPIKSHGTGPSFLHPAPANSMGMPQQASSHGSYGERHRYAPYYTSRASYASAVSGSQYPQQLNHGPFYGASCSASASGSGPASAYYAPSEQSESSMTTSSSSSSESSTSTLSSGSGEQINQPVTLQINNFDCSLNENSLRHFLVSQLKPITPIVALALEGNSYAKVTVPNAHFAKQVVSNLHRKRIGHKRMVVSYTRDSSSTEINTLRCQVAGLLKDVPYGTLSMCKFRELFQSRFKTSISVLDLTKMQDICIIRSDQHDEKYISLHPDFLNSIKSSPLMEWLQHSVPYCTIHFKREQHKGWAEQEIEPLPNVVMTISEIQSIIYPLLKNHAGDIPVASLVHCIEGELGIKITVNESGVNLEHLICCIHGIQITTNNFGIKILGWLEPDSVTGKESAEGRFNLKFGAMSDPLYQISRETIDLVKMSPKSTMKFNRFIPAYHNHFGKQCRVADYGYTKLIELFEALSSVIQIMGDGENRQITLHHRVQVRRFTSDLLRILRAQANKSILLSQLPAIFTQTQNRKFDITEYGVCDVVDILDGLVNSNTVVITRIQNGNDILISIPKRKQTPVEMEKTSIFAGEVVELLRNASQYSIVFQKFVRSYHYHFGYQCRLSDYGFLKLIDLMEAIQGIVEIESTNDEDKQIHLSTKVAQRIFAEQLEDLIREFTGSAQTCMQLEEVLQLHKKKFGYQIQPQILGVECILDAVKDLPYIEFLDIDDVHWIICHYGDAEFRNRSYSACKVIQEFGKDKMPLQDFIKAFSLKYNETLDEKNILAMKHAIQIVTDNGLKCVTLTELMRFITRIICFLDQRFVILYEIKESLNLNITDCCKFGYPNLYTLLRAYWDVFIIEMGPSHDRSRVSLVSQGNVMNDLKHLKPMLSTRKSTSDKLLNALAPADNKLNYSDVLAMQKKSKQNSREGSSIPASLTYSCNKENSYNNTLNGSLNSSMVSDPNSSAGSVSGFGDSHIGLWNRRQDRYLRENQDMNCLYQHPPQPKPETSSIEKTPFWLDPVWTNANSSKIDPIIKLEGLEKFKINQSEFKSLSILPMLMSPYTLSKTENMKQMFSFDHSDKMIP